jgi:hypothetical protein
MFGVGKEEKEWRKRVQEREGRCKVTLALEALMELGGAV